MARFSGLDMRSSGRPISQRDQIALGMSDYANYFTDPELEDRLRALGYGDYVDANPFKDFQYNQSWWQRLLGSLGFRTNYDVSRENARFQSLEYLSSVNDLAHQEDFNSEVSKVQRARAAGENPDLLGTGDVANSPGMPEDTNNVLPNAADDALGTLSSIGSGLMSAFTGAVGLFQSFASIKNTRLANRGLEIANATDLVSGAKLAVTSVLPSLSEMSGPDWKYDRSEFVERIMGSINNMFNPDTYGFEGKSQRTLGYRMSRQLYDQFFQAASSIAHSAPTKVEGLQGWIDELKNGSDFVATDSSKFTNVDPSVLYDAFKPIIEARDLIKENQAKYESDYQAKMTEVGGDYMASLDITGKELGVEGTQFENQSKEYDAILKRAESEAMRKLEEAADKGNELAQYMLIMYSLTGSVGNLFGKFFSPFEL